MNTALNQKIELLESILKKPLVVCGVQHEKNPPFEVCVYGCTPRFQIGCMHSDVPLIISQCIEMIEAECGASEGLDALKQEISDIKYRIGELDNKVYEKKLLDDERIKKEQKGIAEDLDACVRKFLEMCKRIKSY